MPNLYMLVGVPGAGKSTWISNQDWTGDCVIASSDRFIDEEALRLGKTYNEIFNDYIKTATKLMETQIAVAKAKNCDIIWDQTNVSAKSRAKKLKLLADYDKIAIVFKTPDEAELTRRLSSRPGKSIPDIAMRSMIDNFEMPTIDEGFKEIWRAE